ncbi:MAG: siderophore-interacting protein [Microbacteriaceae bacterium]|nr:siderophore-interacting protein [Microbacteriaceae bacterium]
MSASNHSDEHTSSDFIFICPSHLECVLAAGDSSDVAALRDWCASLPRKSYGRVFIEVDSAAQIEALDTPPGVGVTWLVREADAALTGHRLMEAVNAWLDEWVRADPLSGRYVHLWSGARTSDDVTAQWQSIRTELAEIWAAAAEYREQHA